MFHHILFYSCCLIHSLDNLKLNLTINSGYLNEYRCRRVNATHARNNEDRSQLETYCRLYFSDLFWMLMESEFLTGNKIDLEKERHVSIQEAES